MEQILLAYSIPKETVAAITILYRNTNLKVRSPDGDTEYFDIVAGVLQEDTLAPYLFIICLDYVLRTSIDKIKENGFEPTGPSKTIIGGVLSLSRGTVGVFCSPLPSRLGHPGQSLGESYPSAEMQSVYSAAP